MSQKGFSLIELLTGMAIAAIAVNVAVPPVTGLIESVSRENTARQLAGAMGHARTQAILRNQTVVIHGVEGDWSHGWNVILDISGAGHEDKTTRCCPSGIRMGGCRLWVIARCASTYASVAWASRYYRAGRSRPGRCTSAPGREA